MRSAEVGYDQTVNTGGYRGFVDDYHAVGREAVVRQIPLVLCPS